MDDEDYRRTSQEVWKAMAPGWERRRAQLAEALTPVREWLIAELRPQPGETVLELGAGVGDTGFKAAAILGDVAPMWRIPPAARPRGLDAQAHHGGGAQPLEAEIGASDGARRLLRSRRSSTVRLLAALRPQQLP